MLTCVILVIYACCLGEVPWDIKWLGLGLVARLITNLLNLHKAVFVLRCVHVCNRENTITELQTLLLDLLSERAQMLLKQPNFEVCSARDQP